MVSASDAPPPPVQHALRPPLSRARDEFPIVRPQAIAVGGATEAAATTAGSTTVVPGAFLTRPYWGWHAVNSVFDHCLSTGYYSADGSICEVDGTVANKSNGVDPYFPEGYAITPGGTDYLYYDGHNGWDLALNYETVLAAAPGTVTYAGWDSSGWGNTILIDHGNGFSTRYAHLSQILVSVGQAVSRGYKIGVSGSTGNSTGPHLHFGVYRNDVTVFNGEMTAVDPWGWQAGGTDPWPYDLGDLWLTGNPHDPTPDAPLNVAATPGAASATVTWSSPSFDGGSGIGSYTAVATPGGASVTVGGSVTKAVITNLAPGTSYTFTVTAANGLGSGPASTASNAVTPIPAAAGYWEYLGGQAGSAPALASMSAGFLDAFVQGTDGGVWSTYWNGSTWSQWMPLGGVVQGAPAVTSWGPGRVDLFVRGSDNQLWHKWWNGSSWTAWEPLGGVLTAAPAVTSSGPGLLDVFVRGSDNQLWHRSYNGAWSPWLALGGVLASGPGASSWSGGRLDVFVEGTDGQMWQRSDTAGRWAAWEPLGGVLTGAPAAISPAAGLIDVYVKGTDSALWGRRWNGTAWSAWTWAGGSWTSDPGATTQPGSGTVDMVLAGTDHAIYHSNLGPG